MLRPLIAVAQSAFSSRVTWTQLCGQPFVCGRSRRALTLKSRKMTGRGAFCGFGSGKQMSAILPVETARADWVVPLGLAQVTDRLRPLTLAALRPTRALGAPAAARLIVLAEDASVQLLSAVREAAAESGLAAHQVYESPSVVGALTGALAGDDWVLCTQEQAAAWRLQWFEVRELAVARAYRLESRTPEGRKLFEATLGREITAALGGVRGEEP